MPEQIIVLNRMYDVCLALGVAKKHGQFLNRIRLQKFIYLLDVVSLLYEFCPPREGHHTYKLGPYDPAIQNAVDSLAFRGFAKVFNVEYSSNGIHAEYGLTNAGESWLAKLRKTEGFGIRWQAAFEVGQKVNARGWNRLIELVYAEPTFTETRLSGYGQRLDPTNGLKSSSASLMEIINRGLSQGFTEIQPDRELIVELFFRYLDSYARTRASKWIISKNTMK